VDRWKDGRSDVVVLVEDYEKEDISCGQPIREPH
jgi:hypothetical protein